MSSKVRQLNVSVISSIYSSLLIDFLLTPEAVDNQEKTDNELFHEVYCTELEDVLARFSENTIDGYFANPAIVTHIVSVLINILDHVKSDSIHDHISDCIVYSAYSVNGCSAIGLNLRQSIFVSSINFVTFLSIHFCLLLQNRVGLFVGVECLCE